MAIEANRILGFSKLTGLLFRPAQIFFEASLWPSAVEKLVFIGPIHSMVVIRGTFFKEPYP